MEPSYVVGCWPQWNLRSLKLLSCYLINSTPVINLRSYPLLPWLIIAHLFPLDAGYYPSLKLSSPVLLASRLVTQIFGHISSDVASFCSSLTIFKSKICQVAGIELDENSYDYQHSPDKAGPSDFQEFSNMQHCPSWVLLLLNLLSLVA